MEKIIFAWLDKLLRLERLLELTEEGELLSVSGTLYAVTAAIPSGGVITPGVNVTPTTMAEQLALLADKKS